MNIGAINTTTADVDPRTLFDSLLELKAQGVDEGQRVDVIVMERRHARALADRLVDVPSDAPAGDLATFAGIPVILCDSEQEAMIAAIIQRIFGRKYVLLVKDP